MATQSLIWKLIEEQHGVITHAQLRRMGYTPSGIRHRVATGRCIGKLAASSRWAVPRWGPKAS